MKTVKGVNESNSSTKNVEHFSLEKLITDGGYIESESSEY